jgi:hypothetical protein
MPLMVLDGRGEFGLSKYVSSPASDFVGMTHVCMLVLVYSVGVAFLSTWHKASDEVSRGTRQVTTHIGDG